MKNKFHKIKLSNEETNIPSMVSTQQRSQKIYQVKPQFITYPATIPVEIIKKKSENFFLNEEDLLQNLSPQDRGPKMDSKGNILKHTLVGSVQMFMKEQQNRIKSKQQVKIKVEQNQESTDRSNIIRQHTNSVMETVTNQNKLKKHLNKQYKETPMNLEEVRNYIEKCQLRIKNNYVQKEKKEKEVSKNLLKSERLFLNSNQKVLHKFEETKQMWQGEIMKSTEKVNRDQKDSILNQIDDYRNKKEVLQLLDQFNYKQPWQQSLRTKSASNSCHKFNELEKPIEFIRKPQKELLRFPFQSFSSHQAYNKKLLENQSLAKKLLVFDDRNLIGLEIEGKNKFIEEIKSISVKKINNYKNEYFSAKEDQQEEKISTHFIHRILRDDENENQQMQTEIIEENYNKKELLKLGNYQAVKMGSIF